MDNVFFPLPCSYIPIAESSKNFLRISFALWASSRRDDLFSLGEKSDFLCGPFFSKDVKVKSTGEVVKKYNQFNFIL